MHRCVLFSLYFAKVLSLLQEYATGLDILVTKFSYKWLVSKCASKGMGEFCPKLIRWGLIHVQVKHSHRVRCTITGCPLEVKQKCLKAYIFSPCSPKGILAQMLPNCSDKCRDFILAQLSEAGKKGRGRRFGRSLKEMGLQILHSSPKNYRYLRSIFALPSPTTLQRFVTAQVGYFSVRNAPTMLFQ